MGPFCQSCGMPIDKFELCGTQEDGSRTDEYCIYCYADGNYTRPDISLTEMVEACLPHMTEHGMSRAAATKFLSEHLPKLRRWSK